MAFFKEFGGAVNFVNNQLGDRINEAGGTLNTGLNQVADGLDSIGINSNETRNFGGTINSAGNWFGDRFYEFGGTLNTACNEVSNRIQEFDGTLSNARDFSYDRIMEFAGTVGSTTEEIIDFFQKLINDVNNVLYNTLPQVLDKGVTNRISQQKETFLNLIDKIKESLENLAAQNPFETFKNCIVFILKILRDLVAFIDNADQNLKNQFFDIFERLINNENISTDQVVNFCIQLLFVILKYIFYVLKVSVPIFSEIYEGCKNIYECAGVVLQKINDIQTPIQDFKNN